VGVTTARAVVAQDVPLYAVVGGVPVCPIRMRFSPYIVARLQALGWWHEPERQIARAVPLMLDCDIRAFLGAAETAEFELSSRRFGAEEAPLLF
jgi:hypothetical protein